jgi:hypothetical protein
VIDALEVHDASLDDAPALAAIHAAAWRASGFGRLNAEQMEMKVTRVFLYSADTAQARRFYEKCGFTPTGRSHVAHLYEDISVTDHEYETFLPTKNEV